MFPLRQLFTKIILVFVLCGILFRVNAQDETRAADSCVGAESPAAIPVLAHPPVSSALLRDRRYMQVTGVVNVYDAPNGNIIRAIDARFSFVTVINQSGSWTQINPNEWVRSIYLRDVNNNISAFTGIFWPEAPPEYPLGWILADIYPSNAPGALPPESGDRICRRYTPVYILDTVAIGASVWYQIGADRWLPEEYIAKIILVDRPAEIDTQRWISIDLDEQVLVAYNGVTPVFATLVSAGLPEWPTYTGLFHITYRLTRRDMIWGTPGGANYYLEEVPWTMFFNDGRALHGTYWQVELGYPQSRGCLNLSIADAHWLYLWVAGIFGTLESTGVERGPAVYIYSSATNRPTAR